MDSRSLPAKLCFGLAAASLVLGISLYSPGFTWDFYLNPIFLIFIPRLIPFAVAILSIVFGLIYLGVEWKTMRPLSFALVAAQIALFLAAMFGHATAVRGGWRTLGENSPTHGGVQLWPSVLFMFALAASLAVFAANMVGTLRRNPRKA